MTKTLTRIELRDAIPADYDALHSEMAAAGFRQQISTSDDRRYDLPSATYHLESDIGPKEVRELARFAAQKTSRKYYILTVEYTRAFWFLHEDRNE